MKVSHEYLLGIDEVGRGPIAGPVAVGAFIFLTPDAIKHFRGVKESKQLTEEQREKWFKIIQQKCDQKLVTFSVRFQSQKVIDEKGIVYAINQCMEECLNELKPDPEKTLILLDGGLKAPSYFKHQKTIIRGDAKEKVIALASICAKVLRDRQMKDLAKQYPGYGFEMNKGYGTEGHYSRVKELGLSDLHRKSFCKRLLTV